MIYLTGDIISLSYSNRWGISSTDPMAVVSTTGYGDGYYSVFAEMDENGRVAKLIIDFENEIEADDE